MTQGLGALLIVIGLLIIVTTYAGTTGQVAGAILGGKTA